MLFLGSGNFRMMYPTSPVGCTKTRFKRYEKHREERKEKKRKEKKRKEDSYRLECAFVENIANVEETLPGIVETLTKTRMTKGRITLIVLACIAGVLLVGIVVYCFCCKSKPRSQPPVSPPVGHAPNASNPGHEGYAAPGYAAHASNPGHEGYRA